jgi:dsRNA-specific ribonuclease
MSRKPGMIGKRYSVSDTFALLEKKIKPGLGMEDTAGWTDYKNRICYPVERYLFGFAVKDKERLISAIISNAFLNEKIEYEQLRKIPVDMSLETIGDFVLDFVIIDNFALEGKYSAKEIDDFRQFYGGNDALHAFAKNRIRLQYFILWGPDEWKRAIWDLPGTRILADRFEMLIAVIYLEKGVDAVRGFLNKHNFFKAIETIKKAV